MLTRRPPLLWLAGLAVAGLALVPLVFLVEQASGLSWAETERLLWRPRVGILLAHTLELSAAVGAGSAVLGVAAAWCIERTALPARRLWAVLVVLPIAMPEFVAASGWVSIAPSLEGLPAAVLVMTLALYPLVYLPVAGALRGLDPGLEESARSLGLGPWRVFFRVVLPQLRPAVLGGTLVVALYLLAEYGTFALVRYTTFTTEIFSQYQLGFEPAAAASLALVLVALCGALLVGEILARGKASFARVGRGASRRHVRARLGWASLPVLGGLGALVGLALGVPLGALAYWLVQGSSSTLPPASILAAAGHTLVYGCAAAALATALAVPVAILAVRRRGWLSTGLERSTYVARALPGLVVGLAFIYFSIRYARPLYQTSAMVVVAYTVMFLPLAVVAVQAALMQSPPRLEEVGRSLGRGPVAVFFRVTVPLIAPGLAAALSLVFLSSVHELTATLLLRPTGAETLTTQFWVYTSGVAYGAAAPYAALLVVLSAGPAYLLVRRLDSLATVGAR